MKKKYLAFILLISFLFISVGCQKQEVAPEQTSQQTKTGAGPSETKAIMTNKPIYDRMKATEKGKAYEVELFADRKISIETNFKGQVLILSPEGDFIKKVSEDNKYYICAKDGKYSIWFQKDAGLKDYYLIVKTYNKTRNFEDANEQPGTFVEKDGVISGVVDSITDKEDYYYFKVKANQNLRIFYNSQDINVSLTNEIGEETPCPVNVNSDTYILNSQELSLKVTPKDNAVGVQYEIKIARGKK